MVRKSKIEVMIITIIIFEEFLENHCLEFVTPILIISFYRVINVSNV